MQTAELALGFLAQHDAGSQPGVVLIHDVWGVTAHTRDLAQRLAGEGYAVLALDLYRRKRPFEIRDPGEWIRALSDPEALADVQQAIGFLAAQPACAGRKCGVIGFCMGGMYALLAACSCTGLSAAVPFYGILSHRHGLLHSAQGLDPRRKPREPLAAVSELRCPLLAIFGDRDEFVPLSDIRALEAALTRSAQPSQVRVYPGCGHAFLNDTRPQAYRPGEAADAWARMLEFLSAELAQRERLAV